MGEFKKADKQDGGHGVACQNQMLNYGVPFGDWKAAELAAEELLSEAQGEKEIALAHYQMAFVYRDEALQRKKEECFSRAHEACVKALTVPMAFPDAEFLDGRVRAHLKQDDAAKARFEKYLKLHASEDASHPEMGRALMAPAFMFTTSDRQQISMDNLQGKVVLIEFWATWCGLCREALPHIREVAKKFQGPPLVILSVSLDSDEGKWKEFVAKNEMAWLQYRDAGFDGSIAKLFGVKAIPHTFPIDADGVLQDDHIGDASIAGKLKKLIARARELQPSEAHSK